MLFQQILILISSILVSTTSAGKHFLIETEDKEDNVNAGSLHEDDKMDHGDDYMDHGEDYMDHGDDYMNRVMVHLKVEYKLKLKFISQLGICALPIKSGGPCRGHFEMWGFDKDTKKCRKFFYGGCEGNANRFSTKKKCMKVKKRCKRDARKQQ